MIMKGLELWNLKLCADLVEDWRLLYRREGRDGYLIDAFPATKVVPSAMKLRPNFEQRVNLDGDM